MCQDEEPGCPDAAHAFGASVRLSASLVLHMYATVRVVKHARMAGKGEAQLALPAVRVMACGRARLAGPRPATRCTRALALQSAMWQPV